MTDVDDGNETRTKMAPNAEPRLIWDPFLGEYLAQAPARMRRRELTSACPFCADLTTGRVPPDSTAWIRPNDFPALRPPLGECYILIYSAGHDRTFADLTPVEAIQVVGLWQTIYERLASHYTTVMSWETCGLVAGQTQRHPHGQTYGISALPDVLARELALVEQRETEGRGCPFCAECEEEQRGPRRILDGRFWLGFVPPYARYPYQTRLTLRRHQSHVAGLTSAEAEELASVLPRIIRAYNRLYEDAMPYMLALHQLADPRYHFHIELLPVGRAPGKLKFAASTESAWNFWLNDSFPEAKAAELRDALTEETP